MHLANYANWQRSVALWSHFRFEQTDPAKFYTFLAADTFTVLHSLWLDWVGSDIRGRTVVDVGGGPGYFQPVFSAQGVEYVNVEFTPSEIQQAAQVMASNLVQGSGMDLPLQDNSVDICFSSNVAEHVAEPWRLGEEMLRVTKPGGLMVFSYTLWYGPFGGHEMGLTHYLGGERAVKWYINKHGKPPKNLWGESLFKVTAQAGLEWARQVPAEQAELCVAIPRYLPRYFWWVMRVPGLREFLGTNLLLVFRKR